MTEFESSHVLRLNGLILSAGDENRAVSTDGRWWWGVLGADFETGAAEALEVTMQTLLQDGARVVTQGYGNREVTFYAVVGGVDSGALALAEQELALNLGRRGELGWTPPDGWAPETVFDIETSSMTVASPQDLDPDLLEIAETERVYQLRFVCQPWPRTAAPVVVPAVAVPVTALDETVLDAGTALTRWVALSGTIRDSGSFLDIIGTRTPQPIFVPVAPIDLSDRPYLSLVTARGGAPVCDVNGVRATLVGSEAAGTFTLSDGTKLTATRWFWRTDQTTLAEVSWFVGATAIRPFQFCFRDLRARNLPPYSGTLRQSRRSIEVAGSVRTQGTVSVAAPDGESLGTLIFYSTTTTASVPSLRGYRTTGGHTPDPNTGAVSGFVEAIDTGVTFRVPIGDLAAGKCQILARMFGTAGGTKTVTWTAQTYVGSSAVGPALTGTLSTNVGAGQFKTVAIGSADLPPTDLPPESEAVIEIGLTSDHAYDEVWLMNLDDGAVTIVEAGTHSRAWIETATTARPRPAIYVGDSPDRTDAFHDPALIGAWGSHEFKPPLTNMLVVTAGCEGPDVAFEYYPRFMNFVAHTP